LSIDKFFTIIKDGAWHSIDELSDQLGIQTSKLVELSNLLSKHGLLKYEEKTNRIKIESIWKLILPEEEEPTEPKTTVATFIIPPETSIDVQSTRISNISNVELEVNLRINQKIKEIAIKV
jgi:hypothetical protein